MSDPSTLSNFEQFKLEHTTIDAVIDWQKQVFRGTVSFNLSKIEGQEVVLDSSYLEVFETSFNDEKVLHKICERQEPLGSPLKIQLPKDAKTGKLTVKFATTSKCTALQWLHPEQTSGKKIPYLFSQCEAIHARSLYPCFDTPSVKSTFHVKVESEHPVVLSGLEKSVEGNVYEYHQPIPIPSYLFAIASGDLRSASIGPRSLVYSEPKELEACQREFEADTEKFIEVAEKIIFPYEWETYNVLVLPPSFPFGGMENPNITFATPTLISGDRQNVEVIAHELAHSWSGNLVTNSSWEHFWLNEGWTVYLERRIIGSLRSEAHRHFEMIIGWKDLEEAIALRKGKDYDNFTCLQVDLSHGEDPDDAFSTVPYEKGSTFLFYLENLLGREQWNRFIPYYFEKFKYRSLDTKDFKATLYEFFCAEDEIEKLEAVDWNLWLHTPGLPPKPDFDTSIAEPCYKLAAKWAEAAKTGVFEGIDSLDGWTARQVLVFLDKLSEMLEGEHVHATVEYINEKYKLSSSSNPEVLARWYRLAVSGQLTAQYAPLAHWLTTVGRMKFVRPGFRNLASVDRELALKTFEAHKDFYHPICRQMVEKDFAQ